MLDLPNWATFLFGDVILGILLFLIDRRSAQRDKEARERQDKIEAESVRQYQQQLEHTTQIVESIKATLGAQKREVFEESLSEFIYKRTRDALNKFVTLWEAYLSDNLTRLHRRLENEVAILGTNLIDLTSRAMGTLPEDDVKKIKDLAFEIDKFGNWYGTLGDHKSFNEKGNELLEKTKTLLELINARIEAA